MKKVLILTFFFFLLSSTIPISNARAEAFTTNLKDFQSALKENKITKESFDMQTVIGTSSSIFTLLAGCLDKDNCPSSLKQGAVFKIGDTIASLYGIPPASGIYYALNTIKQFNPIHPVYAQTGTGFAVLEPFLKFWKAIRNLVYTLFVVGAVILGLMIMFRQKVSPQVVITIQSALPRLIFALLLVTFSYAIVGFLIDLTYVGVGIFMWSLNGAGLARYDASRYFSEYINANLGQTFGFVFTRGISSGWDLFTGTVGSNIAIFLSAGLAGIIAATILFLTTIFGAVAASAVLVLIGFIIAIIFFLIRLLFVLGKAYLFLLIFLIFGPLIILWNTIIGKGIWDGWLRGVTANLLVFPGVGIVIFLTDVLINQVMEAGDKIWGPPYIGRQHIVIQGLIGIGAIFLLPQIPDIINQLLGVKMPEGKLPEVGKRFEPIGTTTVKELEGAAQQSAIFRKRPGWWPEGLPWPKNPER